MKTPVIIGIAVGLSVVATIGVLIAWDTIQQQEAERRAIEYESQRELRETTLELERMKCEQEVTSYVGQAKVDCLRTIGPSTYMEDCMNAVEEKARLMRLQCP